MSLNVSVATPASRLSKRNTTSILTCVLAAVAVALSCSTRREHGPDNVDGQRGGDSSATPPVRIVTIAIPRDLPVLALRATRGSERVVFLHGMCGEADSYLRAFRLAASRFGRMIALQGDLDCPDQPGRGRTWSKDIRALDRRIETAWRVIGDQRPLNDVVVVGYSLGAVRAEAL